MFVLDGRGNKIPEVIEISDSMNIVAEYRDGEEQILFVEMNSKYVVYVSAKNEVYEYVLCAEYSRLCYCEKYVKRFYENAHRC
jgi:hypothetical protein